MEKKKYVCPATEITDLRAIDAMMDNPVLGPASMPNDNFNGNKAPGRYIGW